MNNWSKPQPFVERNHLFFFFVSRSISPPWMSVRVLAHLQAGSSSFLLLHLPGQHVRTQHLQLHARNKAPASSGANCSSFDRHVAHLRITDKVASTLVPSRPELTTVLSVDPSIFCAFAASHGPRSSLLRHNLAPCLGAKRARQAMKAPLYDDILPQAPLGSTGCTATGGHRALV
jgi:hypothetical protein